MKTIKDCIQFANENPLCFLATTVGDQPHVRALGFWYADETGFYFQTATMKEFAHELEKNPKTEVCFIKHESKGAGITLRIKGSIEFTQDAALKEKVIEERSFLKAFGLTPTSPELILFKIAHGEAHFWTMEDNLKPKEIITF